MKIMIVDDKFDNIYMLETLLAGSGYQILKAKNGAEALGIIQTDKPDLIISDILMPLMDGYTLCREIKRNEKFRDIPFIFYTATYTDPKDEEFALGLGADRFILKPADPDVFLDIIQNLLDEVIEKNFQPATPELQPETIVLKEYNEVLIRKLEDKMRQTEENEKKLKEYIVELEKSFEARKSAEDALRRSEELFRTLCVYAPVGLFRTDKNGFTTYVNPIWCKIADMTAEEGLGNGWLHGVHPDDRKKISGNWDKATEAKSTSDAEYRFVHKDGSIVWVSGRAMPEIDDNGEIIGYIGVINDITKRKLAEQALIESEENFRSFIESAPVAIVISDFNQRTKYINKKFLQLFGYTIEEHPSVNEWWDLAYPDETYRTFCRNRWNKAVEEAMQTKSEITPQECFIRCKDGEIKYVEISFVSLGELNIVTFVDMTDRKKAEKLLAEAEERYRTVFENTVVGLYRTTLDGEIILANPALLKMLGFSSFKEMRNRRLDRNGFDKKHPRAVFLKMMETQNEIIGLESAWKKADGSTIYVKESAKSIKDEMGTILYFEGVVEDITQQKLTELELNAVESKYRTIFINANDAILLMDKDTFIDCNPKAELMFGCSLQEVLGAKPIEFSPPKQPDGKESSIKSLEKITAALSGIPQFFEWQHKKKDGTLFDAEISLNSVELGGKTYIQAMVRDVSDRKKAEQELSNSENQFRSVWEKSFDGMRLLNEEGITILVNTSFCEIVGMKEVELIGKPAAIIYTESERERIQKSVVNKIREMDIEPRFERFVILHDNRKVWLETSNSFIEIGSSRLLLSVFRDITPRKNLIAELYAAKEKAEEMNRVKTSFFANMSHELRTPLIGILGFSELLKDYLEHESETYKMAQTVHSSGTRLLETLNNILRISKIEAERVECKLDSFNIIPLIKDVIKLFQPAAKYSGIDLLFDCDEEEILCYTDDKLFHEIMNNLVHNAIKFSGEGCITVEVKKEKEFAVINVIDNGIGIPADKQDLIWEAFRQVSEGIGRGFEGTGLGLTISKKYTELIKGKIYFKSEEGKGSTFTVEVPLQV